MPRQRQNRTGGPVERVEVTAALVAGFTNTFLQDDFDEPKPTPSFHNDIWELFCSRERLVAVAAPRGHAKSTAGTLAFGLASLLFGSDDFLLIVSATEALAAAHLANMAKVLTDNTDMCTEFEIEMLKCNQTELVVRTGNREFCVMGKGAEQTVRGVLWRNRRPSLIVIDDLESDEQVMSKERREKLSRWFYEALLPCGSDRRRVRFLGTILHIDSLLANAIADTENWVGVKFSAHRSFDDFSEILWPEKWPEERLRFERSVYLARGNASGYSQEYLSRPIAEADAFFRRTDFRPMIGEDYQNEKICYATVDFALKSGNKGDNTVIAVGGVDCDNVLHIIDLYADRMDSNEAVELMFTVQERYDIAIWCVENDNIAMSIGPFLDQEMRRRGIYLSLHKIRPHSDKQARAVSIRSRMRAGGVKLDFNASWYRELEAELVEFPRGHHDDRVDALAYLGLLLADLTPARTKEEMDQMYWEEEEERSGYRELGRSEITGY